MDPTRTEASPMACCCRLKAGNGHDSCSARTSGPDEPICTNCVDSGHPESPIFDPIIKNVRSNS